MHGVTHVYGLLVRDLIVFVAVDAKEWRSVRADSGNRRERAQFFQPCGIKLINAEEMNATTVGRVLFDSGHVEEFRMIAAGFGELGVIHGSVEIDDGGDFGFGGLVRAGVVDQKTTGGLADDGDPGRVDMIGGRIRFDPSDGAVEIFHGVRKVSGGRETVIDGEPGEAGVCEWIEQGPDIRVAMTAVETAAVDEDCGWEWAGSFWNVEVEEQRLTARSSEFDGFSIDYGGV